MTEKLSWWTKDHRAIAMLDVENAFDRLNTCDDTRVNSTSMVIESSSMSILQDENESKKTKTL